MIKSVVTKTTSEMRTARLTAAIDLLQYIDLINDSTALMQNENFRHQELFLFFKNFFKFCLIEPQSKMNESDFVQST